MLGVAALASRLWLPFAEGGYVVTGASHPTITRDARPGGILRAAPQVMSLPRVHDSNSDDFVSHPNDPAQQPGPLERQRIPESERAAPVCCSAWFGALSLPPV